MLNVYKTITMMGRDVQIWPQRGDARRLLADLSSLWLRLAPTISEGARSDSGKGNGHPRGGRGGGRCIRQMYMWGKESTFGGEAAGEGAVCRLLGADMGRCLHRRSPGPPSPICHVNSAATTMRRPHPTSTSLRTCKHHQ